MAAACHIPGIGETIAAELDRIRPDMSGRTIWDDSQWTVKALLDALVQLNQPLDPAALTTISQRFPTEATILMLKDTARNWSLLKTVRAAPAPPSVWIAASNALARARSPGFAATLLRELRPTNSVWISDTGKVLPQGSPGSGFRSNSNMQVPPGFPPVNLYWLTAERAGGDELVSEGPAPFYSIYMRRIGLKPGAASLVVFPSDGYCTECVGGCPDCQTARVDYLAKLARVTNRDVAAAVYPSTELAWRNPAQVSAAVSRALAEQVGALRKLAKQLVAAGALELSDLDAECQIDALLKDFRSDRSTPLTQPEPVRFRLQ